LPRRPALAYLCLIRPMPLVITLFAAILFGAAIYVFGQTGMAPGVGFWYGHPWEEAFGDRAWVMLLASAVLFVLYAVLVLRRASATSWFVALVASSIPVLAALLPLLDHMHTVITCATHPCTDAGGDFAFYISVIRRVHVLSVVLCIILGGMATYGFFARRKA
jgi:hypothetical protein